jgi:hypothetical protein
MAVVEEQYELFKKNELDFLNIENYEFIKMGFKTSFHSTLAIKESKK